MKKKAINSFVCTARCFTHWHCIYCRIKASYAVYIHIKYCTTALQCSIVSMYVADAMWKCVNECALVHWNKLRWWQSAVSCALPLIHTLTHTHTPITWNNQASERTAAQTRFVYNTHAHIHRHTHSVSECCVVLYCVLGLLEGEKHFIATY